MNTRRHPVPGAVALLVVLALVAGGCSSGGDRNASPARTTTTVEATSTTDSTATTEATTTTVEPETTTTAPPVAPAAAAPATLRPGPAGEAFYVAPKREKFAPGQVIWASPLADPPAGTKAWRVLYGSKTVAGAQTAVSGLVYVPDPIPASPNPLPILALAHGTTGLGDRCAPSRMVLEGRRSEPSLLPAEVLHSMVVVATDYEGLGTPGVHPYLVGLSEGRSVLDSIRAGQRFPGAGTSSASPSVVFGHSQGGGAALVATELVPSYAPDTNVRGVAAGAPAAELKLLASTLRSGPFFGFLFMAAAGFKASYPQLDLGSVLTPAGVEGVTAAGDQCGSETVAAFAGKDPEAYITADPGSTEPFASILEENSPGARPSPVPVFLYHGEADQLVPVGASKLVLDRYCRNGTTALRKTYPNESHTSVVLKAFPDITAFLTDRLAGKPAASSC